MTEHTPKLNTCPFCAQPAATKMSGGWYAAGCTTYMAPGVLCYGHPIALQYRSEAEAIAAWNYRAPAEAAAPEGWRLVPVEPTPEMQQGAALAIRFDTTLINKLWTGNAVYRAMLAAAPQPTMLFESVPCAGVSLPLNKKDRA